MSKNKNSECLELKNIKYKTLLQTGKNKLDENIKNPIPDINIIIEKDSKIKKETWSKLDKSEKMKKIDQYIKKLTKLHNLEKNEQDKLKEFLSAHLDKKNLIKNNDVIYLKEDGILENIPNLIFNQNNRKFTLKKNTGHISATRNLGPTKKNTSKGKSKSNKTKILKVK